MCPPAAFQATGVDKILCTYENMFERDARYASGDRKTILGLQLEVRFSDSLVKTNTTPPQRVGLNISCSPVFGSESTAPCAREGTASINSYQAVPSRGRYNITYQSQPDSSGCTGRNIAPSQAVIPACNTAQGAALEIVGKNGPILHHFLTGEIKSRS